MKRIRMHRNQQVRLATTRNFRTFIQIYKIVTTASQYRFHSRHCIELIRQLFRHAQGDVFFIFACRTNGTRIFTAMSRVNRHHNIVIP
ncbi:Uncharacterised protein [Vibrio cholerae]|nr:Uncharacterised protein [Vibrio cholerae]